MVSAKQQLQIQFFIKRHGMGNCISLTQPEEHHSPKTDCSADVRTMNTLSDDFAHLYISCSLYSVISEGLFA